MTIPNGADGVTRGPLQEVTTILGADGGIPRMATFDQPTAEDLLKQLFVLDNDKINDPLSLIYSGLRAGISMPLAIAEALINKWTGGSTSFLSLTQALTTLQTASTNILSILGSLDPTDPDFDPAAVWQSIITELIKPLNLLAPLNAFGFLPDENRPQILQDLQDGIVDAFQTGVLGSSSGNNLVATFLSVLGMHRTGTGAVSQNTVQDAQIGSLLSGGSGLFDTFDGAQATALPSARWEQTYSGSGAGTSGLSGSGACTWATSGATARACMNRYKVRPDGTSGALSTDTQKISVTLATNLAASVTGNNPSIRIQGRMDATRTNYIEARVETGSAEIGIVVSGTYTRLGSTQSISGDTNGTWDLKLGTNAGGTREFVLLRNGVTVLTRQDSGATSVINAANRFGSFSQLAGVQWIPFTVIFFQLAPPDIEAFGASDRLAGL